jgi:hypothetical protein
MNNSTKLHPKDKHAAVKGLAAKLTTSKVSKCSNVQEKSATIALAKLFR